MPEDSDALDNFGLLKSSLSTPGTEHPTESKKDLSQTAFKVLNCLSLMPKRRDTGRINLQCCYLKNKNRTMSKLFERGSHIDG